MPHRPSTRQCSGCRRILPLDFAHFYRERRGHGGYKARCKGCIDVKNGAWVKQNPERRRVIAARRSRRQWEQITADPERQATRNAYHREWERRKYGYVRSKRSKWQGQPEGNPRIPAEPFAKWLRSLGDSYADIGLATHLPARSVWRILNEQKRVELDTVDRALLAVGDGTSLTDLYSTEELAA